MVASWVFQAPGAYEWVKVLPQRRKSVSPAVQYLFVSLNKNQMSKIVVDSLSHSQKVRILYKTILRLHRGLPPELRDLGDKYVRDEFRRHRCCNPMESQFFMTEWAKYAVTVTSQLGLRGKKKGTLGDELDIHTVEMLNDDQVIQLYELMIAAKGLEGDTTTANDFHRGK